ncbi:MAG TPA: fumarylacetoacetate hydrolase family protein [Candidatus Cybelea sp.]|nr:fumarylacetoacetate hydrolase family protein [Candidatus Cybelea sp.]
MKFCRFQPLEFAPGQEGRRRGPAARTAIVEGQQLVEIDGEPWRAFGRTGRSWQLAEVKLLPPAVPGKIVCVGRNYAEHAKELGNETPQEPLLFLKPPSAILAPEEPILLPPISQRVDFEGELAVIISRSCRALSLGEATEPYIAGYTCLNDVTARDLQKRDGQWTRAKGFDTFCPFGPVLETDLDLARASVETRVNGTRKQSACLSEMIFSVDAIIRHIAQVMTLEPGDVIATGTPAGIGALREGDVVEITVSGIGTLRNRVARFRPRAAERGSGDAL